MPLFDVTVTQVLRVERSTVIEIVADDETDARNMIAETAITSFRIRMEMTPAPGQRPARRSRAKKRNCLMPSDQATDRSPQAPAQSSRYNAEAVQQQIERDRRRHKISKQEERLIHGLLKGRSK